MSLLSLKNKPIRIAQKMVSGDVTFDENMCYVYLNISSGVLLPNTSEHISKVYDPLKSRKHFWEKNFGLEPLPIEQANAAEKFAGSLGQTLDLTSSEMQHTIDQTDQA